MSTRNFAPISIEDLIAKIKAVEGDGGIHALLKHLGKDIKVEFDLENFSDSPKDFGPKALMGFHTEANGLTYCGMCAGGDWEHPVFFCIYWDGKKLRGYVPTEGNPWNTTTKAAYGNDEKADAKNARKRWPDKFDTDSEVDFEFEPDLIRQDILERLLPAQKPAPDDPHRLVHLHAVGDWVSSAEYCMNALLDAHESCDRKALWRALQGMRILLGRTPPENELPPQD